MAISTAANRNATDIDAINTVPISDAVKTSPVKPAETAATVLCRHCGRTASNGLTCIGACVADSNY